MLDHRVINPVLASMSPSHPVQHRPTFSILSFPYLSLLPADPPILASSPPLKLHLPNLPSWWALLSRSTPPRCSYRAPRPAAPLSLSLSLWPSSLPQVAHVPPSSASSWLMSSLGPELCQGAWRCSGQTRRASGGPWWSLGTEYGHWRRDRKVPECPTCRYSDSVSVLGAGDCYFGH